MQFLNDNFYSSLPFNGSSKKRQQTSNLKGYLRSMNWRTSYITHTYISQYRHLVIQGTWNNKYQIRLKYQTLWFLCEEPNVKLTFREILSKPLQ